MRGSCGKTRKAFLKKRRFFAEFYALEKIQMVTEAALVDYEKEERMNQPGIVGYIVKDGDDLWSLAKKYSTTEESILLNNELLSKELKTGDKILIFRESLSIL